MNIVFFGSSKHVITIIEVLEKNFDLALAVTTENPKDDLALQGETLRGYPVIKFCLENKIPHLSVQQFNNLIIQQLKKLNTPVGILASFGAIIPKSVLDIFKYGILNIHPSLLPKYRGPTPVQTVILNGEKETGVTIIKLDEEIDHGPILAQVKEPIFENDTAETLYERLFKTGANLLPNIINKYLKDNLNLITQNHKIATFTNHLTRQDGFVDIDIPPSPELLKRMINAYFPWPGCWTKFEIRNSKFEIIKFLPGEKIQVEGKKPVSYKDFINGYPNIGKALLTKLGLLDNIK